MLTQLSIPGQRFWPYPRANRQLAMKPIRSIALRVLMAGIAALVPSAASLRAGEGEAERFFENKVRPLLAEHCFKCHGEEKHKGGLRLDSRAAILTGGDQGPALVPGDADKSL